jgi:hypothetical protein
LAAGLQLELKKSAAGGFEWSAAKKGGGWMSSQPYSPYKMFETLVAAPFFYSQFLQLENCPKKINT